MSIALTYSYTDNIPIVTGSGGGEVSNSQQWTIGL